MLFLWSAVCLCLLCFCVEPTGVYVHWENCQLCACRKFKLEATIFISFVNVLLLFFVEYVNTLICCFIWYCILLVLLSCHKNLIAGAWPPKRLRVEIVPVLGLTSSIATLFGKRPDGSPVALDYLDIFFFYLQLVLKRSCISYTMIIGLAFSEQQSVIYSRSLVI